MSAEYARLILLARPDLHSRLDWSGSKVNWADIPPKIADGPWSEGEKALLECLCALSGVQTFRSFGASFSALTGRDQETISNALAIMSSVSRGSNFDQAVHLGDEEYLTSGPVVRVRLGREKKTAPSETFLREYIGYKAGLSIDELWRRSRGEWALSADRAIAAGLLLVTHDDEIVLVATIDGLIRYENRVAIDGRPLAGHPLVGQMDPVANRSRNPVAYGFL